jgi:hypothetical protein
MAQGIDGRQHHADYQGKAEKAFCIKASFVLHS